MGKKKGWGNWPDEYKPKKPFGGYEDGGVAKDGFSDDGGSSEQDAKKKALKSLTKKWSKR
jgi:hypothetical protein